jgi:hypothetical protein
MSTGGSTLSSPWDCLGAIKHTRCNVKAADMSPKYYIFKVIEFSSSIASGGISKSKLLRTFVHPLVCA